MHSIETEISSKIASASFEFSKHAVDQMMHRSILVHEVKEALSTPEILEYYPNDKYGPSCLVLGFSSKGKSLHVVCTHPDRELLKIITIYEPDPKLWLDFRIRLAENYMIETKVTYTLEHDGHFYLVENVPARISPETGEQFFSPETVQRLQSFIFQKQEPKKVVQTPVFEFAT